MLDRVRSEEPELPVSVEIEKPRADIELLFLGVDVLLFSREYALAQGFTEPIAFLKTMAQIATGVDLVCAWESKGAAACAAEGAMYFSDAYQPSTIVDTLGAGDTFNAAIIDARLRGLDLRAAVEAANSLAGKKCGLMGFEGLSE
jgi:ketohexokinase